MKKKTAVKKRAAKKKAAKSAAGRSPAVRASRPTTPAHAYQEGSVESVGARPTGTDREDRSGEGTRRPSGKRAPTEKGRDSFVSSEVGTQASVPGKDPRTRS